MDDRSMDTTRDDGGTESRPDTFESPELKKEWENVVARARRVGKWRELIG